MSTRHPSSPSTEEAGYGTLPVIEEHIDVGTRLEEAGAVRVRVVVEDVDEDVELPCASEHVRVDRVAVGRPAHERQSVWMDGDAVVVPIYEEVLIVKRRLMLKEEIRLTTERSVHVDRASFPVRRERAVVERRTADGRWEPVDAGTPSATAARVDTTE
jgi:stress response protein YsnF